MDFESAAHPDLISIPELTSFLYLAGLYRLEFRRALDELLHNNPTGRFPYPAALISQLQSWKIANSLSVTRDDASSRPQDSKKETTPRPHLHPTPCTWYLASDRAQRLGNLSTNFSKNPKLVSSPIPSTPTPTPQPSRWSKSWQSSSSAVGTWGRLGQGSGQLGGCGIVHRGHGGTLCGWGRQGRHSSDSCTSPASTA